MKLRLRSMQRKLLTIRIKYMDINFTNCRIECVWERERANFNANLLDDWRREQEPEREGRASIWNNATDR